MALTLTAPVSLGDALDRLTILAIKFRKLPEGEGRERVAAEAAALRSAWVGLALPEAEAVSEFAELSAVNLALWEVEDRLRAAEAARRFDAAFVEDARAVYRHNDRRAALKRAINLRFNSAIVEEKLHPRY